MTVKKYYWLKLKEDFFRQKEIKKLRKIAGGDTYTIIYLKMLLLALKNDNKLYFEGVEENFAEEIALELDEDAENVKMTLAFLQNQKLIEVLNEEEIHLLQCETMTGVESASAERVRRYRAKQKALQCNTSVTPSNKNVTTEKEIDIELEKEIDIDKDNVSKYANKSLKEFSNLYQKNLGVVNGIVAEWLVEMSGTIDIKLFRKAIEIATDRGKCNPGYVKGIIKQWLDVNITTYEQLEAYKLNQKEVKSDVRRREGTTETESSTDDRESEERRAELLRRIRELDEL